MINLQTRKSYLTRDEMRLINGGKMAYGGGCFSDCTPGSNSGCSGECANCIKSIDDPKVGACGS